MITLSLKDDSGGETKIKFPETLEEFSLNNKVAFDVHREEIGLWLSSNLEDDSLFENRTYYLYLISRAISEFLDFPLENIIHFDIADLTDDAGQLLPNVLKKHFKTLSNPIPLDLDSVEVTLLTLYESIIKLIDSYKFEFKTTEDFNFTHNGKKWKIPHIISESLLGTKVFSNFTVMQSVKTLQIHKFLSAQKLPEKSIEDIKNNRFTGLLKLIAITAEGENPLPLDNTEFEKEVDDRMVHFQDIDFKSASDLCFFLIHSMRN